MTPLIYYREASSVSKRAVTNGVTNHELDHLSPKIINETTTFNKTSLLVPRREQHESENRILHQEKKQWV